MDDPQMTAFDYQPRTRILYGSDKLVSLGAIAGELGARRVLLVTDPGIIEAGHHSRALASLEGANIETYTFDDVEENPTTDHVERGRRLAERHEPELIVGLGGGSAMDCAKGINFVHTNGGTMKDYWGVGKALQPMLPMIAVPTTAGTGSETQSFALISDAESKVKMACGDKKASFRAAILDPKLTLPQPPQVTALTGIDALAHAVETYVTTRRNPVSMAFSREAWQLLSENFIRVLDDPDDLDARGSMQLGACFAGMAIENSMLGAAHAMANPLTANYGVVHGQAVGLMLPHVVRFNGEQVESRYEELTKSSPGANGSAGTDQLADFLETVTKRAKLAVQLRDLEVPSDDLPRLAAEAAEQWTGQFNPRQVDAEMLKTIYERAY